jgi:hypothetical protein
MVNPHDTAMNENHAIAPIAPSPGPHGLGGMLWLFGVPLMLWGSAVSVLLPLELWRFTPAELDAAQAMAMQHGIPPSEFSVVPADELPWIIAVLSGIVVAEAFFRRASYFRWLATAWLFALCALRWHDGWMQFPPVTGLHGPLNLLAEAITEAAFAVPILYLWLSDRARNTFTSPAPSMSRGGMLHAFLDGPRDWGGGVWCVAGVIVLLACMHASLVMAHWPYIVPPELTPEIASLLNAPPAPTMDRRGNAASALITMAYTQEVGQVRYARLFVMLHAAGLLLALWSLRMFLHRASILRWTLIASALFLVGAHTIDLLAQDTIRLPCVQCGHYDGRYDHLAKALSLFVAITAIQLLPAVRRRFRKIDNTPRM